MKVLTYNVHLWEGRDGRLDIERLAAIIESSNADVVSLNEVLHPVTTHYGESRPVADLANLLRMDWAFGESNRLVRRPGWWGPVGNAVLSRHPIIMDANHYLPRLPMTQGRNMLTAKINVSPEPPVYDLFNAFGPRIRRNPAVAAARRAQQACRSCH